MTYDRKPSAVIIQIIIIMSIICYLQVPIEISTSGINQLKINHLIQIFGGKFPWNVGASSFGLFPVLSSSSLNAEVWHLDGRTLIQHVICQFLFALHCITFMFIQFTGSPIVTVLGSNHANTGFFEFSKSSGCIFITCNLFFLWIAG